MICEASITGIAKPAVLLAIAVSIISAASLLVSNAIISSGSLRQAVSAVSATNNVAAEKGAETGVERVADLLTTDGKTVTEDEPKEADAAEKDAKADAEKATEEASAEASEEVEKDAEEVSS